MFDKSDNELTNQFFKLKTNDDLAELLEVKKKSLLYFAYSQKRFYNEFIIKKENGKERVIYAPVNELKVLQKKIAYVLNLVYQPKDNVYGFVKHRDSLGNANRHVKRREIIRIDLKDYFYQFHFGRVKGMFEKGPYFIGKEAATTLANLVCVKRRLSDGSFSTVLPQGAPTSPILSNMICRPFDNDMIRFSKRNSLTYTRYADDIVLSPKRDASLSKFVSFSDTNEIQLDRDLISIFSRHKLIINKQKTKYCSRYERQMVTGVVVNHHANIKREYSKSVRAILHNCEKNGIYQTALEYSKRLRITASPDEERTIEWFKNVVIGKIRYIGYVTNKKGYYYQLANKANQIFKKEYFDLTSIYNDEDIAISNVFIITSDNKDDAQGTAFVVPGCGVITCYHLLEKYKSTELYSSFILFDEDWREIKKDIVFDKDNYPADRDGDYAIFLGADSLFPTSKKIKFGNSDELKKGDEITLIGYPEYLSGQSTSLKTRITKKGRHLCHPLYFTDKPIVHGFSGGIVLNSKHEIVGIVAAGITSYDVKHAENIPLGKYGFIPINSVKESIFKKYGIDL